jgi:hypothetical protein
LVLLARAMKLHCTLLAAGIVIALAAFPPITYSEDIEPALKTIPDRTSILFHEGNVRKGEILSVDNNSEFDQTVGIELPTKGLVYSAVIRKPDQTKVPSEKMDRFTVPARSGIVIIIIPDPDRIEMLDGRDIAVKVGKANRVEKVYWIPIKVSPELKSAAPPVDRK